jgi:hypothetical protein
MTGHGIEVPRCHSGICPKISVDDQFPVKYASLEMLSQVRYF